MNEQKIELSLSLVNGLLQYLGTKPYGEVAALISAIQEQAAPQVVPSATATAETNAIQ